MQTSEKRMNAEEIMEVYHNLWKVEKSFRVMKTTLEVRPVSHWTETISLEKISMRKYLEIVCF